jgi:hypothetical protein
MNKKEGLLAVGIPRPSVFALVVLRSKIALGISQGRGGTRPYHNEQT